MAEPTEIDVKAFNGKALRVARTFRGLTVSELADNARVSRQIVSSIENESMHPFRPMLLAIADALQFPLRFFFRAPVLPPRDAFHFRRGARVTLQELERARAHAALFGRVTETFGTFAKFSKSKLPKVPLPRSDDDVESGAEKFRAAIGFRLDSPIAHCVRAAEAAGVFVGKFDTGSMPIHGFACAEPVALLMLKSDAVWSRRRFSTMHEVGHLTMHGTVRGALTNDNGIDRDMESQADRFAGAALVPRVAFWREFPRPRGQFDWPSLIGMKQRWGVSVQALVHRAYDLKIINAIEYRTANIHITKQGWKTAEPGEAEAEEPELCAAFVEQLRKRASVADLCARSELSSEVVSTVLSISIEEQIDQSEVIKLPGGPKRK
ncbi:MAG: ImmA/IrrE family metallo-endopeptidase [Labilithrix sp.]|nr:ImmA/IrrE family metallo-endopeptidase [Labilithrix sp.]